MSMFIKFFAICALFFMVINSKAMENGDIDSGEISTVSSFVNSVSSESQSSLQTLVGCIKISPENYQKLSPQVLGFIESIIISPKARDLLTEIKTQHDFIELCLVPKTEIASHGCWNLYQKKILIRSDYAHNLQEFSRVLLWESCNAANFRFNTPSLLQLCPDEDVYAMLVEFAEYFSCERSKEIKIDYLRTAQQDPLLKEIIEISGKIKISQMIEIAIASLENFMGYWHEVNQPVIGSNFRSFEFNTDLYRHADLYRSYFCYWKPQILQMNSLQLSENEQFLIVHAFSQRSFDLAKTETKMLNPYGQKKQTKLPKAG